MKEKYIPEEREAYEASLKYYRDLKNVIDTAHDEGIEEGQIRTAKNLLSMNMMSDQKIAQATELSLETIVRLKSGL